METQIAPKQTLFKTAKATISCAQFSAGEYVGIENAYQGSDGVWWFTLNRGERGPFRYAIAYPENHLSDFCL